MRFSPIEIAVHLGHTLVNLTGYEGIVGRDEPMEKEAKLPS